MLGQFGIYIARNVLSILGLSAWVLPWVLGSFSYMSFKGITPKEKLLKGFSFLVSILCISILANIRDTQGIKSNNGSLFNSNLYEHGAGGSLGAFIYSGMPFYSNSTEQVGGFMKLWLGSLGSTVFSLILLLFSLSFHFSLKPYHSFLYG